MTKNGITLAQPKEFQLDSDKIKTVEDIVCILKGLDIKVYDNYLKFNELKQYLKEVK